MDFISFVLNQSIKVSCSFFDIFSSASSINEISIIMGKLLKLFLTGKLIDHQDLAFQSTDTFLKGDYTQENSLYQGDNFLTIIVSRLAKLQKLHSNNLMFKEISLLDS